MPFPFANSTDVFIEIGQSSLKVLNGDAGLEFPLARQTDGRLSGDCKERLTRDLREFVKKNRGLGRQRAFCAIGARGVSIRRLTLPTANQEEFPRLLRLQIESQFPLPPEELAWGFQRLLDQPAPRNGPVTSQELIVAAVKKEVIEDYSALLSACGLSPEFTLSVLARDMICPQPLGSYALLDIGRTQSELIAIENGVPSGLRVVPWGGDNLTRAIETGLHIDHAEAEKLKLRMEQPSEGASGLNQQIQDALRPELKSFADSVKGVCDGRNLYVSGRTALLGETLEALARAIGAGKECRRIGVLPGEGRSAAILGLQEWSRNDRDGRLLVLQTPKARDGAVSARPAKRNWAAIAVTLAIVSLGLRYWDALFQAPRLSKRLAEIKDYKQKMPSLDRELTFLQYLKTNQPPYLDALFVLANAAPGGTRFESTTMNRGGDLAIRGTLQNAQLATDFRAKLIDSGFFAAVTPEEQTPSPDGQKLTVRIVAQWKPASARASLPINSTNQPPGKLKPGGIEAKSEAAGKVGPPGPDVPKPAIQPANTKP